MDDSGRRLETVQLLFERGDRRALLDVLNAAHPADVAHILRDLSLDPRWPSSRC